METGLKVEGRQRGKAGLVSDPDRLDQNRVAGNSLAAAITLMRQLRARGNSSRVGGSLRTIILAVSGIAIFLGIHVAFAAKEILAGEP